MQRVRFRPSQAFQPLADTIAASVARSVRARVPGAVVDHVGGTSVAGMLTKGDVDVCVRVSRAKFRGAVAALGKRFTVNQRENWTRAFASFKDDTGYRLPVGVQLVVRDSVADVFICARDRLREDAGLRLALGGLKARHNGGSMARYRRQKARFFERLLADLRGDLS